VKQRGISDEIVVCYEVYTCIGAAFHSLVVVSVHDRDRIRMDDREWLWCPRCEIQSSYHVGV